MAKLYNKITYSLTSESVSSRPDSCQTLLSWSLDSIITMGRWVIWVLKLIQHHRSYHARLPIKGNVQNVWNTSLNTDPNPEQTRTWDQWFTAPVCLPVDHARCVQYYQEHHNGTPNVTSIPVVMGNAWCTVSCNEIFHEDVKCFRWLQKIFCSYYLIISYEIIIHMSGVLNITVIYML